MASMGRYCKAYLLSQLRQFPHWTERLENARKEEQSAPDGKSMGPRQLGDDSIVYLQENYMVTDSIFMDENVLFDSVTDEWKQFCVNTLDYAVPDYVANIAESA